jgi:hypothetical protein
MSTSSEQLRAICIKGRITKCDVKASFEAGGGDENKKSARDAVAIKIIINL